jgi:hypothetical protein
MDKYIVDAFNNGGYITGQTADSGKGSGAIMFTTMTDSYIRIRLAANFSFTNKVFRMMICTAEDWAVSHKFVPYAPTNRELYTAQRVGVSKKIILGQQIWTQSGAGMYYCAGISVDGIDKIDSIVITGFTDIRPTDNITPLTSNDRTKVRFLSNVNSFSATNSSFDLYIIGTPASS